MWAATLKVMAGTQQLLPTTPIFVPFVLPSPRHRQHPHPYPPSSCPSAPPGSPARLPPTIHSQAQHTTTKSSSGILEEASAACQNLMRVAHTLARRTNAERRIARKRPNRSSNGAVGRSAPASTAPAVVDDSHCRAATARPPHPSPHVPLNLVGLIAAVSPSPPPPSAITPKSTLETPRHPCINAGPDAPPNPSYTDASVSTMVHSYVDASVNFPDSDDAVTSYGVIRDPFARSLARLLPLQLEREAKLSRAIYLRDSTRWAAGFTHLPPTQRVYLNVLAEIFRPWTDPDDGVSLELLLNPAYNLFIHWYTGWNAIPFPGRPPEPDPRFRYDYLTDAELRHEVPFYGRGYVVEPSSTFFRGRFF